MIIEGSISSNKTKILIDKYVELLNSGVPASKILVLVQNSNLKNTFITKTLENLTINVIEKLQVYSFYGLVYNTISENWAFLENSNTYDNPVILPNLAGLEVSQFILKEIIKDIKFKGYNSKKSLLHQLFRRYSLIVQNNLTDEEIEERSKILGETFADDAKVTLKKFLKQTLQLRDFDYLRQTLLFNFIYKNSNYFSNIEYLIVDDGDEITPACMDFIKSLKPKEVFIAYDKLGSSRSGYLSADKSAALEFEKIYNQETIKIDTDNKLKIDANTIFTNILDDKSEILKNFSILSPSKRASMIDLAIKEVNNLIENNIKPNEISIITPIIDDMLKFGLNEKIENANLVFISGSEKLIQNKLVQATLTILKLNTTLKDEITEFDIRVILSNILGIPIKYCKNIIENFNQTKTFMEFDFNDDIFNSQYQNFISLISDISTSKEKLSEQVCTIYKKIFKYAKKDEINKFNFFVKQLRDFENIFKDDFENKKLEIINQIENSIIAENPYSTLEIKQNDLIVSTPQKIIDNQIQTKYQIWLDISSDEWIKSDTGPLYNAWVFQKGWDKDSYTIEDNINLSKDKTARILRKLVLCASEHIYAFSSLFDGNGNENFGGIEKYLPYEQKSDAQTTYTPITPREDQKPVLEYKSGKMAISAVPGAGKTTILLFLILKLLDKGILPENIFVLTYMESAARNFRDRIKNIRQNSTQIPNISTIHGLALRIIKENSNFERLGLNPDFEICDDTQRSRIVKGIATNLKMKTKETEEYDRAISVFKLGEGSLEQNINLNKFEKFYNEYQNELRTQNLIDYEDILTSSVQLLRANPDILAHYQETCKYIIEDEAQDSSSIQQELISLLSGKYKNLIRCGDINQAITTTFSNADVDGFRKFISESQSVKMDCSQRCTEDVWKLANNLIDYSKLKPETQNAFYEIYMRPVIGKNPIQKNAITKKIFSSPLEERNYILKTIKNTFTQNPKATVGVLLRSNYQVAQWLGYINDSGLKSITRSESLEQKIIFKAIYAILQIVINPFDNNNIANNYETLAQIGLYKQRLSTIIREFKKPFIETNCDEIENADLCQFYWDINYWLSMPHLQVEELVIKIGLYYFSSEIEKSNVYLISTLIKRLSSTNSEIKYITERLGELAKKPSLSGFKFFSEEEESNREFIEGKVQVMTLHKSKGDEFDLVFLPEFSEKNLTLNIEDIKLKSSDFMEEIRRTNPKYKPKTEFDLKSELLAENLRLLYVGITRAKKNLFITVSEKSSSFGKTVEQKPSVIFEEL